MLFVLKWWNVGSVPVSRLVSGSMCQYLHLDFQYPSIPRSSDCSKTPLPSYSRGINLLHPSSMAASALLPTSRGRQSDDKESRDSLEDVYIPQRQSHLGRVLYYSFLLFLVSGWFVAIDLYRRPRVIDIPGLSSPHPFPPEIFERVPRIFQPDDRYVGPSNQTHHNWDHLVAGKTYNEHPDGTVEFRQSHIGLKRTTRSTSRIRRNTG